MTGMILDLQNGSTLLEPAFAILLRGNSNYEWELMWQKALINGLTILYLEVIGLSSYWMLDAEL
jgi:hypothetical protein